MWRVLAVAAALAALSLAVVAPAPAYDPWMWLVWGREVAEGGLDTREGPAFKPLPVAVCALLAPLGGAAPVAWVLLVRTAGIVALWLAWRLGRRLAGGSRLAGAAAVAGVVLAGRLLELTAAGAEPALAIAAALGAAEAWASGRPRVAASCALACGLLRVEAWPFLLAAGAAVWGRRPEHRPALLAAAALLPAAWLVPEWLGSGDALRSGGRARIPNPGQPALADVPALASLWSALGLVPWPLWAGAAALVAAGARAHLREFRTDAAAEVRVGPARVAPAPGGLALLLAGLAWFAVVAAMAQAGFSGEPRYSLPGAALVAVGSAAGLGLAARRGGGGAARVAATLAALLLLVPAALRAGDLPALRSAQAYQWQLAADLEDAIAAAGGRAAVLGCGTPYVGPLRAPLAAYRLHVAKATVEPDLPPRAPGTVFRSALVRGAPAAPAVPRAFAPAGRAGRWELYATCGLRVP